MKKVKIKEKKRKYLKRKKDAKTIKESKINKLETK